MTQPVNAIWIGDRMGPIHAACLKSFLTCGHDVILHAYRLARSADVEGGLIETLAPAGKPVIAIDQISGGAKVSAVLGRTGWPYVFEVQTVTADIVAHALAELQISAVRQHIAASQTRMVELTRRALAAGVEAVKRS
ncbi:hypothetical protein [Aliihoeflea sp. 2WW]|uniref:hypothetical protein n=1 Tax=Aliihoeflea sp. 2WW TaxID=1381123 RepID=UPI0005577CFE|nr:hypothetical protein [Aliihoeflea sp. 2WW]